MEIKLTKFNFADEVLSSDLPVIVDFWATWCGPCKMIAPTIEELSNILDGKAKVGKVNVDEEMELAVEYKIEVIPTLLFFKDGKVMKKTTGVMTKEEILTALATI
jgi:thioredoxin 1